MGPDQSDVQDTRDAPVAAQVLPIVPVLEIAHRSGLQSRRPCNAPTASFVEGA